MNFLKKLIGENCYLCTLGPEYADIVAVWSNDIEVSINTGDISDRISLDKQKSYLEYMASNSYAFIIVTKNDDKPVGMCRLKEVDLINRRASLGIFIGEKDCWNKGIGTEAIKLLLDFGFNVLNLQNVMLQVYSFNERAISAYRKCGFKEFGRRRNSIIHGKKVYDEVYMDILDEEFSGSLIEELLK